VNDRAKRRTLSLGAAVAILLVGVFVVAPRSQDPDYHLFADTAPLGSVPNAANVLSNAAFLAVGLWGLGVIFSKKRGRAFPEPRERRPWALFFAAMAATAFGSAYYHWSPTDATLFWDRLPMTVAFTSLVSAVLADRVDPSLGRRLLLPLVAFGLAAILAWRLLGDLRPYIFLQAGSILVVLVATFFFPSRYDDGTWMLGLLAGYGAALLFELLDHPVRAAVGLTGGHPLKHLAAAAGTSCVVLMLARRAEVTFGSRGTDPPPPSGRAPRPGRSQPARS